MAEPNTSQSVVPSLPLTSYDTALALLPPRSLWPRIDRLRALYDRAYPRWPPHVNLVYPFVRPELLDEAVGRVGAALAAPTSPSSLGRFPVRLARTGVFEHKKGRDNTIYLCEEEDPWAVERLRGAVLASLGAGASASAGEQAGARYRMHLTVAQSDDADGAAHKFLVEKVGLLPRVEWEAAELAVLVRERDGRGGNVMRLWGTIGLEDGRVERLGTVAAFYQGVDPLEGRGEGDSNDDVDTADRDLLQGGPLYCAGEEPERWVPFAPPELVVASYNVLAEFEWPPSEARYPLLVRNILAESAQADVLVLQEVTDGFLSYLLSDKRIRDAYPFCSHGPPHLDDIEPLPSYLNIVVLAATPFDWEYVSLNRKHKGALVARFKRVGRFDRDRFRPVVLAAVHLIPGLGDDAIAAKKADVKRLIGYLSDNYSGHPWIVAGDFNVTTSPGSINAAIKAKAISEQSAADLASLDNLFSDAGLVDAWRSAVEDGPDAERIEAEQGATWDPTTNGMAAIMAANSGCAWPQRYDRILVRGEGLLEISDFNMFGFLTEQQQEGGSKLFASDHWGVRCTLNMRGLGDGDDDPSEEVSELIVPVIPEKVPEHLASAGSVKEALAALQVIPSEGEATKRKRALDLLKSVILDAPSADAAGARSQPTVVVVPVGSYALGVWTSSSDIDVLCIGPFSSNTFFALASQRVRKAAAQGIKLLRRVRAHTGTMLELEVHGVKVDLQYCPAASVAERWPDVLRIPSSDPVWSLSAPTLSKLKAIRDADYLRRSVPDLTTFRLAHRFVKTWAKSRGIYAARFGFLSGIQISVLLARVQKLLAREVGAPPTPEALIATFFHHYAAFDWSAQLAFDPLFHRRRLPYSRTAREPLAILGYFPPALNTALAASVPSTKTLAAEFRRASDALRSATDPPASWSSLLSVSAARDEFLAAYKSYVKLDVQYWGLSLSRGAQFLGWLESRCVMLLVDLHRRSPRLHVRMWPARFVERDSNGGRDAAAATMTGEEKDGDADARDFRGCYLIGLDKGSPDMAKEDLKVALGALETVLDRFEAQMMGDEKYYDARSCWLSASVVNRDELGELELDSREWGEYTPGEEEADEEEEEGEQDATPGPDFGHEELAKKEKKKKGSASKKQIAAVDLRADKTKKFRPAIDALNRIRWDPQLDSSDYVVGYEDRFSGTQEKELSSWKSEQTDEEFIPQHRILYFRRKSDGRVVWDRRTRLDELFGNAP
ncbi:2'-5' RNA ligase superfamily-domain-containing protein [Thermothelomyces heterothallicus CBS 202.75]|uniref:2'-5' RNA ligase superfamily-domain-containing protein n=1 Tax=Thermothelomyces heterothallicus CBS 202.75 TaxID=1149848 RepID=UPI003741EB4E